MPSQEENDADEKATKEVLLNWRQGDSILNQFPVGIVSNYDSPLTAATKDAAAAATEENEESLGTVVVDVPGFVVLTQTCDIVRSPTTRSFIDIAPLRTVNPNEMGYIRSGYMPQYLFLPSLEADLLVGDLDRVMTMEKSVALAVAGKHVRNCETDYQARSLATSVARKYERFAFPNDFSNAMQGIKARIKEKHGKASPEGRFLAELVEFRVRCAPSWDAAAPDIVFLMIGPTSAFFTEEAISIANSLIARFIPTGLFKDPTARFVTYETTSSAEYLASSPLDFDHLSDGT